MLRFRHGHGATSAAVGDAISETARIPPPRVQPIQLEKIIEWKLGKFKNNLVENTMLIFL
jgi:hypothetical protein